MTFERSAIVVCFLCCFVWVIAERKVVMMFCSNRTLGTLLKRTVVKCDRIRIATLFNRSQIGNREWVGFGVSGTPHYIDRVDYPFPAVRFMENTNELIALREKEKGDWRKLTCEEKKCLYRASFCQTFSEVLAPTGEWKSVLGAVLMGVSLGVWIFLALKKFCYRPLPETFSEQSRRMQLRRMLDLRANPITGVSSKWDYEKEDWKKKIWHTSGL